MPCTKGAREQAPKPEAAATKGYQNIAMALSDSNVLPQAVCSDVFECEADPSPARPSNQPRPAFVRLTT